MLDYLQTLVALYPQSNDQQSVKKLLDYVGAHLSDCGFSITFLESEGVYSLYASTRKNKHSRILLQGHIDVVPGDQPLKIEGDRCYGRGVYDMLFGTAAFMQLADDIKDDISSYDLAIMLSGDEEVGGFHGAKHFLDNGYTTDICILPDAGDGFGSLSVAAKGILFKKVRINGRAHHGSRPWEGDGAASKLVHFLAGVEQLFDRSDQHNSTLTISGLEAGIAMNQGPASAEASLDIRYKDKADLARIKEGITRLLTKYDGEIVSEVTGSDYQLDTSHHLVQKFIELYEEQVGHPIKKTKAHGSSDARFFAEKNMPVIMLRPDGSGAHGDEEWISISSMNEFYKLLKDYVLAIGKV